MAVLSTFTGLGPYLIPERSEATPGLFNNMLSVVSQNLDQLNSDVFATAIATPPIAYNAGAFVGGSLNTSTLSGIQAAISKATASNASYVYVPQNLLPYDPSKIVFSTNVRMVREGADWGVYDIRAYGAAGNFIQDDTASIVAAIAGGSGNSTLIFAPAGIYRCVPSSASSDAGGTVTIAFQILSNMHITGAGGSTSVFKLADNQSTDASPKNLSLFFSTASTGNWSIRNLVLDMNGANNKISPSRPTTYQQGFNMAHISVSGASASVTDIFIEYNQFLNGPGTNEVVLGQSNTLNITLGNRITIAHNLFLNNGTDTNDSSALYTWANDVDIHDNIFWEDNPPGTVGKTGNKTAVELHGTNNEMHNNLVHNYLRGAYAAGNFTSIAYNQDIHDNLMEVTAYGVALSRSGSAPLVRDIRIHDNVFRLIEKTFSGGPASQIGIDYSPPLSMTNVDIEHNHFSKSGATTLGATAISLNPAAGQPYSNVRINHNSVVDMSGGVALRTDSGGSLGNIEIKNNAFISLTTLGGNSPLGVYVDATNTVQTLVIDNNCFIDEQVTPTFQRGITLTAGTITDLYVGSQVFKGLSGNSYEETGGIAITNRLPLFGYGLQALPSNNLLLKSNDGVNRVAVTTSGLSTINRILSSESGGLGVLINTIATTNQKFVQLNNTGGSVYFGVESSVGGGFFTGSAAYETVLYTPANNLFISAPVARFSTVLNGPSGTAILPPFTFSSESSLGWYRSAASTLAMSYGTLRIASGGLTLATAGDRIRIKNGTNASFGTAVMSVGSVNVATNIVTANSVIFLTDQTAGGTLGDIGLGGIRAGSGFTIQSTSVTDTSTVAWLIIEPSP